MISSHITIVTANILFEKEQTLKVSAYFQSAYCKIYAAKDQFKEANNSFLLQPIYASTVKSLNTVDLHICQNRRH